MEISTSDLTKPGTAAAAHAREVRKRHARSYRATRGDDLQEAMDQLTEAMKPLRSEIVKLRFRRATAANAKRAQQLAAVSDKMQRERRKIWKMQQYDPS